MDETYGIAPFSWTKMLEAFRDVPEVEEVILFGSRALGRARRGSDVDLVLKGARVTALTALDLAGRLNEREPIPYQFDVLAEGSLDNADLAAHIARVGRVIYRAGSSSASHHP